MTKSNPDENPWRAIGYVSLIGVDVVICILIGYFVGTYLSNQAGGEKGWIIGGVLIGFFLGIISVAFIIRRFLKETES